MFNRTVLYLVIVFTLLFTGCIIAGRVVDDNGNGVSGVTITLSGDASMSTITDSNGNYQLGTLDNLISAGTYTVTPSKSEASFTPVSKNVTIATQVLGELGEVPMPVSGVDFEANADTFSDDFDTPAFTTSNWSVADLGYTPLPVWEITTIAGSNLGFHAYTGSWSEEDSIGPTVNFADNRQSYDTRNLSLDLLIRLDYTGNPDGIAETGGCVFSSDSSCDNCYMIGIGIDNEGSSQDAPLSLIQRIGGSNNDLIRIELGDTLEFNTFYRLKVQTDSDGKMDIYLYKEGENTPLATIPQVTPTVLFSSGLVGLIADAEATFNNFSITGTRIQ